MIRFLIAAALAAAGTVAMAAHTPEHVPPGQAKSAESETEQTKPYGVYNRLGAAITARELGRAKAVERAVEEAGAPPTSDEAKMIRLSMGQSPEIAGQPNDQAYDERGRPISDQQAAERYAALEVMARTGVDPNSDEAKQIIAASEGDIETPDGEPVEQQTMEEMAKEIAVQEAIVRSGAQPGSQEEALIKTGADVFMDKMRRWWGD